MSNISNELSVTIFIFKIQNRYSEYAKCSEIISKVNSYDGTFNSCPDVLYKMYSGEIQLEEPYHNLASNWLYDNVLSNNSPYTRPTKNELMQKATDNNIKLFIFLVDLDEEYGQDYINLQYYYLIRQMFPTITKENRFLLIITSPEFELYDPALYKIGQFLALEINRFKSPGSILCIQNHETHPLPYSSKIPPSTRFSFFFPLIEISRENYEILTMPIDKVLQNINKNFTDKNIEKAEKNDSEKESDQLEGNKIFQIIDNKYDLEYLLFSNTLFFLQSAKGNLKNQIFGEKFFSSLKEKALLSTILDLNNLVFNKKFFSLIKDLPLFTIILFAVSEKSWIESFEDIQIGIYEAEDYAAGIIQLLENIIEHSQRKKGFLSFRFQRTNIEKNENGKYLFVNPYLNDVYREYCNEYINEINHNPTINQEIDDKETLLEFLELNIIDSFNQTEEKKQNKHEKSKTTDEIYISPVIDEFIINVKNRLHNEPEQRKFIKDFDDLKFGDFFTASKSLQAYENHYKNIVKHYGLKRFSNSVSSSRGFFSAISTYDFSQNNKLLDQTYYKNTIQKRNPRSINNVLPPFQIPDLNHTIPGTKYQVLLPINNIRHYKQNFVGIDTGFKWKENFDPFIFKNIKIFEISINKPKGNKSTQVEYIGENIYNEIFEHVSTHKQEFFYIFSISISGNQIINKYFTAEIIAKGLLYAISQKEIIPLPNIAFVIKDCPKFFIPEFVHNIMIVYDRFNDDKKKVMENKQIYCSDKELMDDFLIAGSDINNIRKKMISRASLRGYFPSFLFLLNYILEKQSADNGNNNDEQTKLFSELPFDLILKNANNKTTFEIIAETILDTEIVSNELGCKIANSHIQVGSKIHIENFFDAEILFQSNYFSARFAALLAKDIYQNIKNDKDKENGTYKLIGYGNYSELVIYKTQKLLEHIKSKENGFHISNYEIVTQKDETQDFTSGNMNEAKKNEKYIFIVPINSTLTTHNKLIAWFIDFSKNNNGSEKHFLNYAIVLVRDQIQVGLTDNERKFWSEIKDHQIKTNFIVDSKKENNTDISIVKYFVQVGANWHLPLECEHCYPTNILEEIPIIETNITSIIPSLQLENQQKERKIIPDNDEQIKQILLPSRVDELAEIATYRHIKRDDNHYLYYFSNNDLIKKYQNNIEKWLSEIKPDVNLNGYQTYNFIVTPLNDSNTGFIDLINEIIFEDAAQIIRFEINREYRNNFVSKYSYITKLFENLQKTSQVWPIRSKINFFFVDEGIITGRTINRAKSLLCSLIPNFDASKNNYVFQNQSGHEIISVNESTDKPLVDISIFEGIFVLLNRLSVDSIRNYIDDIRNYYFYANFPISSIRNTTEFCYLCRKDVERKDLARNASLADLQQIWLDTSLVLQIKDYTALEQKFGKDIKSINRITYTAKLSTLLNYLEQNGIEFSKEIIIAFMFNEMLLISSQNTNEETITFDLDKTRPIFESCLKLLSRPYFIYKYSIRKVTLQIVFYFLTIFLNEPDIKKNKRKSDPIQSNISYLIHDQEYFTSQKKNLVDEFMKYFNYKNRRIDQWIIENIHQSEESKARLFSLFVDLLAELNSTRLLRKNFVDYVSKVYTQPWFKEAKPNQENQLTCNKAYRKAVDQVTSLNRDESKSLWLEYLLLNRKEYQINTDEKANNKIVYNSLRNHFEGYLYLENTKVIRKAITNLSKKGRNEEDILKEEHYFLDNFRHLLQFNNVIYYSENESKWKFNKFEYKIQTFSLKDNEENRQQLEIEFSANENLNTKTKSIQTITYENIFRSMIELERFLHEQSEKQYKRIRKQLNKNNEINNFIEDNETNKIIQDEDDNVLLRKLEKICEYLNEIAMGNCAEIVLADPNRQLSIDTDHLTLQKNKYGLSNTKGLIPTNVFSAFSDKTFLVDTEHMIIKLYEGKENYHVFLVIYFNNDNPNYNKNFLDHQIAFTLRNLLLFRGEIQELIEDNLDGSSLRDWALAVRNSLLLKNSKASRHADDFSFTEQINKHITGGKFSSTEHSKYLQAMILHLMADINISTIYHEAISKSNIMRYDSSYSKKKSRWNKPNTLYSIFSKEVVTKLFLLIDPFGNHELIWNLPNHSDISHYYINNAGEQFLIIISMLENAVKHSPYNTPIILDIEQFSESTTNLFYFTITNSLLDKYDKEESQINLQQMILSCLLYPVEERYLDIDENYNGISLFASNYRCRQILYQLNLLTQNSIEPAIKYEINKSEELFTITFKIPLYLIGEI